MAKAKADIRSLARGHTETAIKTLAGVMNQAKAPAAARVAAASALLDRGWGKPDVSIDQKITTVTPKDHKPDLATARERAQLRVVGGTAQEPEQAS